MNPNRPCINYTVKGAYAEARVERRNCDFGFAFAKRKNRGIKTCKILALANVNVADALKPREHSLAGKAQHCQGWARAFESPCSLLAYPDPRLRVSALTRSTHCTLACANRLTITALVQNGCGINSAQTGQPVGAILVNGNQIQTRARVLLLSLARITALGCELACALEGCLSLSNTIKRKLRHKLIIVIYVNIANARVRAFKTQGLLAACCQHELDHSNGSLIIDA